MGARARPDVSGQSMGEAVVLRTCGSHAWPHDDALFASLVEELVRWSLLCMPEVERQGGQQRQWRR